MPPPVYYGAAPPLRARSAPSTAAPTESTSDASLPSYFPAVGVGLAIFSSLLIGLSFVLQKRAMTAAQTRKSAKRTAAAVAAANAASPPAAACAHKAALAPTRILSSMQIMTSPLPLRDPTHSPTLADSSTAPILIQSAAGSAVGPRTADPERASLASSSSHSGSWAGSAALVHERARRSIPRLPLSRSHTAPIEPTTSLPMLPGKPGMILPPASPSAADSPNALLFPTTVPGAGALEVAVAPLKRKKRGPPYLYSPQWWVGTVLMLTGEVANLGAYGFSSAIVVAPLGALSVVISAVLSSFILLERMNLQGKLGCALALMGAVVLVLNAPQQNPSSDMTAFAAAYFSGAFITWNVLALMASMLLIFYVIPRTRTNALGYLLTCSLLGSLSVTEIQAVSTAVVNAAAGDSPHGPPWTSPLWWIVLGKATVELTTQLYYLNLALSKFSAVLVTPLYYACFTSATLTASFLLNPPWATLDARTALTCLIAFAVICSGVLLLQTSKITTSPEAAAATAAMMREAEGIEHLDVPAVEVHGSSSGDHCDVVDCKPGDVATVSTATAMPVWPMAPLVDVSKRSTDLVTRTPPDPASVPVPSLGRRPMGSGAAAPATAAVGGVLPPRAVSSGSTARGGASTPDRSGIISTGIIAGSGSSSQMGLAGLRGAPSTATLTDPPAPPPPAGDAMAPGSVTGSRRGTASHTTSATALRTAPVPAMPQPWLHTPGHLADLLPALLHALQSTIDEAGDDEEDDDDEDDARGSSSRSRLPPFVARSSSPDRRNGGPMAAAAAPGPTPPNGATLGAPATGFQPGHARRRSRAMSWPGPGMDPVVAAAMSAAAAAAAVASDSSAEPSSFFSDSRAGGAESATAAAVNNGHKPARNYLPPRDPAAAAVASARGRRLRSAVHFLQWVSNQIAGTVRAQQQQQQQHQQQLSEDGVGSAPSLSRAGSRGRLPPPPPPPQSQQQSVQPIATVGLDRPAATEVAPPQAAAAGPSHEK
ncbi:magnesium transporter NIPA-domain-containing protein [Blastocladiella britannica]|nr:magnesium transporter NIPA-domain-containing protein [Blastocladiella britannica]